jgi:hypothetical protein
MLFEWLTRDGYADGEERLVPEVLIECGFGGWNVTLKDHEMGLQATFECDQWEDIPALAESLYAKGKLPWKEFRTYRTKKKKK